MKPILYDEFETKFDTNGIGILTDTIDVSVDQELNGIYELTLKYPVFSARFADLQHRAIILATVDPVSQTQPFRIYRYTKPSKGVVTFYARHVAYDLMGIVVSPFVAYSVATALIAMKTNAVTDCPFVFQTDKDTSAAMTVSAPKAIWTLLGGSEGSVLDVYGGEYEFDRFKVMLHNRRGADRGVNIRYGKNLTSLEQDANCANCYTGAYPYWLGQDSTLVELPEKKILAEGEFSYTRIMPLDLSSEWQEAPTEEALRARAEKYMKENEIGKPIVSIKVEFVPLAQTEEYKNIAILEQVLLGDTVSVYFPDMLVTASARAVKTRWKPLLNRYDYVNIGNVKANIADTIVKQEQEIAKKPTMSMVQQIMTKLGDALSGALGGAVRLLDTNNDGMPDELYIADNPDPAQAVRVWRFNYMGWAASRNGYNGPFDFGATLENGILATAIVAAHLTAGTIRSKDGESFFVDLDNGVVNIKAVADLVNDLDVYKGQISTQLEMMAEGMEISIAEKVAAGVSTSNGNLQTQIDEITTNYRFTANGQYIGRTDDEAILRLSAGIIDVLVAGYATATFDRTGMTAEQANIKTLHMGDYTLALGNDGHLTLS